MDSNNLDNINKESKRKNKLAKKDDGDEQDQFRVVINKDANSFLDEFTRKVGDGFEAGTITKSDIANYVFKNLERYLSESDIKAMRALHFDERKVLSSILKRASEQNEIPEEIKKAIREHYGVYDKEKKRSSKTHSDLSTEKNVDKSTAA
jgi:hypothetical protein